MIKSNLIQLKANATQTIKKVGLSRKYNFLYPKIAFREHTRKHNGEAEHVQITGRVLVRTIFFACSVFWN